MTYEELTREAEAMKRRVDALGDQHRMLTREGSTIVLDKAGRRAIRVEGTSPETETREAFAALGWRWIDRVAGEEIE